MLAASRSGAAVFDRSAGLEVGNEIVVVLPKVGDFSGKVVAMGDRGAHVRLDMDDTAAEKLDALITARENRAS